MPPDPDRIRVKICGLREPATLEAAVQAGADWIGFVLLARSPRLVTAGEAATLAARIPAEVDKVGLFVSPQDDDIARVLDVLPLQALQVYAPASRIMEIRRRFGVPVWQAVGVVTASDLPGSTGADALLIESRPPAGADRPGGNGVGFDWHVLQGWSAPSPWLLAGGLRPETVGEAIRASGAVAVDVSSGVEISPGVKDVELIRSFIRRARRT